MAFLCVLMRLVALLANVAELGAERMEETIGKAGFRDTASGTGIPVDKMLALTGQLPVVAVQVNMPTPEELAEQLATDRKLDEITERLRVMSLQDGPQTPARTADSTAN